MILRNLFDSTNGFAIVAASILAAQTLSSTNNVRGLIILQLLWISMLAEHDSELEGMVYFIYLNFRHIQQLECLDKTTAKFQTYQHHDYYRVEFVVLTAPRSNISRSPTNLVPLRQSRKTPSLGFA